MSTARFVPGVLELLCLALALSMGGCGSSSTSSQPSQPISVSLSAGGAGASPTINASQSVTLTATVLNDPANAGVQWNLTGAGTLGSKTPTSAVYFAPSAVSAVMTATVTATSVADSSKSAAIKITVDPGASKNPLSVSIGGSKSTSVDVPVNLTATVQNDPQNAGVSWNLVGYGLLSNETKTSVTYNSLSAGPSNAGLSAIVTATSITDPSQSASLPITANPLSSGFCKNPFDPGCALPVAVATQPYTATLPISGGVPPYHVTLTPVSPYGIPPYLTVGPGGVISGVLIYEGQYGPNVNGGAFLGVVVSDSATPIPNSSSGTYFIPVATPSVLTILTSSLSEGSVGAAYNPLSHARTDWR